MPLVSSGALILASAAIGDGAIPVLNSANAFLGVGDSSTAFNTAHTDLQATTNKLRKQMDSTYPQRSGGVITFRATLNTGEGNFAWQEHAVFNAPTGGQMASRKVESLGTKTNTQSWQITVSITVGA